MNKLLNKISSYECGSARKFQAPNGDLYDRHTMTCLWDKTWTNTHILDPCVWVACLKPPPTPEYAHLVSTDWDGEPIQFEGKTIFVCERGKK